MNPTDTPTMAATHRAEPDVIDDSAGSDDPAGGFAGDPAGNPAAQAAGWDITLEPVDPVRDAATLQRWLSDPKSVFWAMTDRDVPAVQEYLRTVVDSADQDGWLGRVDGAPLFYAETYAPASLLPADALDVHAGDLGMHLLVSPAGEKPRRGLTAAVMRDVMDFCLRPLAAGGRGADRVVVEPDVRNTAIHRKNATAGFRVLREVEFCVDGQTKRALLSVCTREDFAASPLGFAVGRQHGAGGLAGEAAGGPAGPGEPASGPYAHLDGSLLARAQRHLVAKALTEFSHERLIAPSQAEGQDAAAADGEPVQYTVVVPEAPTIYSFRARVLPLEHWLIEEDSLVRLVDGVETPLDVQELILELQSSLQLPERLISTYLEELASTLAGAGAKLQGEIDGTRPDSRELLNAGFQQVEAAMSEGHPSFVANNGRIGFGLSDYWRYAPEMGRRTRLMWVAVKRELSHLALGEGMDEDAHLDLALSPEERGAFNARLADRGLDPADFHFLPLHPWQADHRLAITFSADIARGDLVPLGPGGDEFQPQQSLRTFFNLVRPESPYVKVALSVQNMGFLRGLSPAYMRPTPAINDWVAELVGGDPAFAGSGFSVLRERAALGYTGDVYHRTAESNPHRKMLAALWRESPLPKLEEGERVFTMAALLHRDHQGLSFASELIRASGLTSRDWVRSYLEAYVVPLVHALLAHDLVFMPHGENLILRLRENTVTGAFMKDIGEEVAVVSTRELPADIARIRAVVPGDEKALSIFTDVFDGVLRHLSGTLHADGTLPAEDFWKLVAECLDRYELAHPGTAHGLAGDVDLRAERFAHSCLNRLQLRNTLQMVDIGNQAESLLYAGTMRNPVARRR